MDTSEDITRAVMHRLRMRPADYQATHIIVKEVLAELEDRNYLEVVTPEHNGSGK